MARVSGLSTRTMSVSMQPGATALTRIPEGASSSARERVIPTIAVLVQAYATSQLAPRSPQMEEMLTMQPCLAEIMAGSTA